MNQKSRNQTNISWRRQTKIPGQNWESCRTKAFPPSSNVCLKEGGGSTSGTNVTCILYSTSIPVCAFCHVCFHCFIGSFLRTSPTSSLNINFLCFLPFFVADWFILHKWNPNCKSSTNPVSICAKEFLPDWVTGTKEHQVQTIKGMALLQLAIQWITCDSNPPYSKHYQRNTYHIALNIHALVKETEKMKTNIAAKGCEETWVEAPPSSIIPVVWRGSPWSVPRA